jgi:predicted Zn-dependent protease
MWKRARKRVSNTKPRTHMHVLNQLNALARRKRRSRSTRFFTLAACAVLLGAGSVRASARQDKPSDVAKEVAAERKEADRLRRRGEPQKAVHALDELIDDDAADVLSRSLRALCRADLGRWNEARADAEKAAEDARKLAPEMRAECARNLAGLLLTLGEADAARTALERDSSVLDPAHDARDAWCLGSAQWQSGLRDAARATLQAGCDGEKGGDWRRLLARARCERKLGFLERASRTLVEADERAEHDEGDEPDLLAERASVYFEADGELEHKENQNRAPGTLYKVAIRLAPTHEASLLGMFELGRVNWNRTNRAPQDYLSDLFAANPSSIPGLLAACGADLDDGQLVSARSRLDLLHRLAPKRREVRTLDASLAWIEHREDDTHKLLDALHAEDAADAQPEREIARHLSELYRFPESLPFAQAAVARDPLDALAYLELGRALANTGDETGGLAALEKSADLSALRQNAWRHNTILALKRMQSALINESAGELSFAWSPDAAEVLRTYMQPFYAAARSELAERYGFTPTPTHIEVFEHHKDFSVRSTGFEGFPALGVCFGPVVTAVSPVSELRGKFCWARTSFHEFTHVIHLGLSHNRCPRWITEGLATWEEEHKHSSWTRNMRRDLIDSLANDDLIKARDLNRAFRGPRILFGYYEGGLLCKMLIDERGFAPMIRLLEAFDRGLDLDQALKEVFALTPEQLDAQFERFVRNYVANLRIEPRWTKSAVTRIKLGLDENPPIDPQARARWAESWSSVAWGYYQSGERVDSEQALRHLDQAQLVTPRALFLRAEFALGANDAKKSQQLYEQGFAAGGEDYRARMALAKLSIDAKDWAGAERALLAAEHAFPGYADSGLSAELSLAQVYGELDRPDDAQRARERWLAFNSDEYPLRLRVARWHAENGRNDQALRYFQEACDVDPFRRALHVEWGKTLSAAGKHEEALREYRVALMVSPELDADEPGPIDDAHKAELLGHQALELLELDRADEADKTAREALALDEDQEQAKAALESIKTLPQRAQR